MDDRKGHNNVNDDPNEDHLNWPRRPHYHGNNQSPYCLTENSKSFIQGDFKIAWATVDNPQATGIDQRNLFIERVTQHHPLSYADALCTTTETIEKATTTTTTIAAAATATATATTSITKRSDINSPNDKNFPALNHNDDGDASSSSRRHIRARHS